MHISRNRPHPLAQHRPPQDVQNAPHGARPPEGPRARPEGPRQDDAPGRRDDQHRPHRPERPRGAPPVMGEMSQDTMRARFQSRMPPPPPPPPPQAQGQGQQQGVDLGQLLFGQLLGGRSD